MIAVDTNVLVYAHREDLAGHSSAAGCLRQLAEGAAIWSIPVFCVGEFLRVVTHPRIFENPSTLAEATGALRGLLNSPSLHVLMPGARFAALLLKTCLDADTRGNLVFDAQIAALCRENGVNRLLTLDRDFARFPDLKLYQPEDLL